MNGDLSYISKDANQILCLIFFVRRTVPPNMSQFLRQCPAQVVKKNLPRDLNIIKIGLCCLK